VVHPLSSGDKSLSSAKYALFDHFQRIQETVYLVFGQHQLFPDDLLYRSVSGGCLLDDECCPIIAYFWGEDCNEYGIAIDLFGQMLLIDCESSNCLICKNPRT